MMNWYEANIEEGVRHTVKLLRDNGINTTCSCHHSMIIEAECYVDEEVAQVADLLFEAGWEDFRIELYVQANKYAAKYLDRSIRICLPMEDGTLCPLGA